MLPRALLAAVAALVLAAAPASAATLPAGSTAILSGAPSLFAALPTPVNDAHVGAKGIDEGGGYVAFSSGSDGLLADDDDAVENVYVKNRATGAVELASRRTGANGEPSHGACRDAAISGNHDRVAFVCEGPLDPADTNGEADVYVRDLAGDVTILASRGTGAGGVGNGASFDPSIDANGGVVAFASYASNLDSAAPSATTRVYRRELGGTETTQVVSRANGVNGTVVRGIEPSIDGDGSRIAFVHEDVSGPGLDPADQNGAQADVYVRDTATGATTLASRADGNGKGGNGASTSPALSENGAVVAFVSTATTLDNATDPLPDRDVYRRSLAGKTTQVVNTTPGGTDSGEATWPSINTNGGIVAFSGTGTALDPADTGSHRDAYVKNVNTGEVTVVSRADGPAGAAADDDVEGVAVNADGTKVAWSMPDGRITPDVDLEATGVALRDTVAGRTFSISRPAGTAPFRNAGGQSTPPVLSADGRFAAFVTAARGLGLPGSVRRAVVVRDRRTGAVVLASRADGPGGTAVDYASDPAISADGRRVAFVADLGGRAQVWVRDLPAGRTFVASRADGATGAPGGADSELPALDADGSRVAFTSAAANLADGDTDEDDDVHVRDLATGRTLLASRANGAAGVPGDAPSFGPRLSANGERVAFVSSAANLGDGDTDPIADVHLRDLAAGTTRLVSAAPRGPKADGPSGPVAIDATGTRVAFATTATNLAGASATTSKILVRDLSASTLALASRADGAAGGPLDGFASSPEISPDGAVVAFDLSRQVPAPSRQVLRRDLLTGRTDVVSRGAGGAALARAGVGGISRGGACIGFGSDGVVFGRSDYFQAYVRAVKADCGEAPKTGGGGVVTPRPDRAAPVLRFVRLSPRTFRVRSRGAVLRLRASEAARLTVRIDRLVSRRRARQAATMTRQIRAGRGSLRITPRVGRRVLRPGRYRLTVVARDRAGNASRAHRLGMRVVRR